MCSPRPSAHVVSEIDEEITVANMLTQNTTYCRKCFANTLTVVYDLPSIVSIMLLIIDLPQVHHHDIAAYQGQTSDLRDVAHHAGRLRAVDGCFVKRTRSESITRRWFMVSIPWNSASLLHSQKWRHHKSSLNSWQSYLVCEYYSPDI